MVRSSFLNVGIIFAILKLLGKLPDKNDKFVISDSGLLKAVWNNFKNLLHINIISFVLIRNLKKIIVWLKHVV